MFARLLKSVGFGLTATAIQDQFIEESPGIYNWIAGSVGGALFLIGYYLDAKQQEDNKQHLSNLLAYQALNSGQTPHVQATHVVAPDPTPDHKMILADHEPIPHHVVQQAITTYERENKINMSSTGFIRDSLNYTAGFSLVTSITHLARRIGTNSGNIANLSNALFLSPVVDELINAEEISVLPLKWNKSRFALTLIADYLSSSGIKNILNNGNWNLFDIISFPIGMALSIAETVYSYRNDTGLNLKNVMLRRGIKISLVMNMVYTVLDFAQNDAIHQNDMLVNDALSIATSLLLIVVTIKLNQLTTIEPLSASRHALLAPASQPAAAAPENEAHPPMQRPAVVKAAAHAAR